MSVKNMSRWTCDKCSASVDLPTSLKKEDKPIGWCDLIIKDLGVSYDHDSVDNLGQICGECRQEFIMAFSSVPKETPKRKVFPQIPLTSNDKVPLTDNEKTKDKNEVVEDG